MIVDTSALTAVLFNEADAALYEAAMAAAGNLRLAAPTLVELTMVLAGRKGDGALPELDRYLAESSIEIVPFTAEHAALARTAFLRYGKGRHRAGLNFGDCIAYATSKLAAETLLFKGDDFRLTDVEPAL